MANDSTASSYVGWEEVVVSTEQGRRRKVHYYLKRGIGGGRDLVVVGKEKKSAARRDMSFDYAIKGGEFLSNRSSVLKLRSRREVVDWLNSILSDEWPNGPLRQLEGGVAGKLNDDLIKNVQMRELGQDGVEFMWLGSSWTCRKRRRHYQSFCRNGAVISAQDFVYVLAEEDKRLVAYLDDMYEDARGNKMVVVRWFHKIDEVGLVLPRNDNDREIFSSLCLQDLSIECIDGLATVLSPEHYEKLIPEATRKGLMPFVCYRQFDSDDVKPFDITRIKGYWKQEILRSIRTPPALSDDGLKLKRSLGNAGFSPKKRIRWSKECDLQLKSPNNKEDTLETNPQGCNGTYRDSKGVMKKGNLKDLSLSGKDNVPPPISGQHLIIGSQVEVLSQDSGIRGCWFRASIIKKHANKVKVQYTDMNDADDDSKHLEEWVLASRLASPDALGIRLTGRTIVRPSPSSDQGRVSSVIKVGSVVDAWWHDGWWEGIVMKKESDDRLNVYFPGEKQEHVFCSGDLRSSKEWYDNAWHNIKERLDLVSSFSGVNKVSDIEQDCDKKDITSPIHDDALPQKAIKMGDSVGNRDDTIPSESHVRDLSKDHLLASLRWKSSGKKRRVRSPVHKLHLGTNSSSVETGLQTFKKMFVNSSFKFDPDNCKYAGDPHFSSSIVSLTNLVMSQ